MARKTEGWTPYGLEAIRIQHLRRRRAISLLMILGLVGLWAIMFETTTTTQTEIFANGRRAGAGIQIDVPEQPKDPGPVTVSISPGRVTRADTSQEVGQSTITRPNAATVTRAPPYNWSAYVLLYGPFILLGAAAWFLGKRRGAHDEVNFGIYKGAMPLELSTATARQHIITRKATWASVFGKTRRDHLPAELIKIERVEQEDDA